MYGNKSLIKVKKKQKTHRAIVKRVDKTGTYLSHIVQDSAKLNIKW